MARAQIKYVVTDQRSGKVIQNAKVFVYETGTLNLVPDLFAALTGGAAIAGATLISNAQGEVEGYVTTPRNVKLLVTDNANACYYPQTPGNTLDFPDFTEDPTPAYEDPVEEETDDASFVAHVALETGVHGASQGTFAARGAAGTVGRRYKTTDTRREYYDDGTIWRPVDESLGWLNLLDYGALINSDGTAGNGNDDRAAWVLALLDQAATGKPIYVPYGSTGKSRISTGITGGVGIDGAATATHRVIIGQGGQQSAFGFGGMVLVYFDSGGFEFNWGTSGSLRTHNLYIIGNGAAALWMNNAAGLSMHNTTLRGVGASDSGLRSTDNFFVYADSDCSFQSGGVTIPSILLEATSTSGGAAQAEAWDINFDGCRLNIGNAKLVISANAPSLTGQQVTLSKIVTENFNTKPLLDVEWTSGVTATAPVYEVTIDQCNHADATGVCPIATFTNNSSVSQPVHNLFINQSPGAGTADVVHTAGSQAVGFVHAFLNCRNGRIRTSTNTPTPAYITHDYNGWHIFSNTGVEVISEGSITGEAFSRMLSWLDGTQLLGSGSATQDVKLARVSANRYRMTGLSAAQTTYIVDTPTGQYATMELHENASFRGQMYLNGATDEVGLGTAALNFLRMIGSTGSVFGVTPIARPTTAHAEAAYVENAGGVAVNDDSTFGGYTLRQIVKALQDFGVLT